ncbi:hypothetical protein DMUE_1431 [Dictyocoela muelleri]|nr:hypothetical protein DMUE_1431 [Dictyocoela muelleri]
MLLKETGIMIILSGLIYFAIGYLIFDKSLVSASNILILTGLFCILPKRSFLFKDFNGIGIFIIGFFLVISGASFTGLLFEIIGILIITRPRINFSLKTIYRLIKIKKLGF